MNLIGFDVAHPEPDLVGFSIKVKAPDAMDSTPLGNRMAFSYPKGAANEVTGDPTFPSLQAPFQKFRWMHYHQGRLCPREIPDVKPATGRGHHPGLAAAGIVLDMKTS